MVRVRFAPSPTGSLHLGGALTAVANRRFADEQGGMMLLRIDDTDEARADAAAEGSILRDLEWLGVDFDEGPIRQSRRGELYREAARKLLDGGFAYNEDDAVRLDAERRPTLLRADGSATYHLASVVDDVDFRITHVIRGRDHLPNTPLHQLLARALGAEPPEYVHHGLLTAPDGSKLSKRHGSASVADLREAGIPPEAVRTYLEELGLPRADVQLDPARLQRLSIEAIQAFTDEELSARVGAPTRFAPALRGARTLIEAKEMATLIAEAPAPSKTAAPETLERLRDLRSGAADDLDERSARELVREVKAVGGDLRAVRLALTGRERGPELAAVIVALPREEALRRIDAAL